MLLGYTEGGVHGDAWQPLSRLSLCSGLCLPLWVGGWAAACCGAPACMGQALCPALVAVCCQRFPGAGGVCVAYEEPGFCPACPLGGDAFARGGGDSLAQHLSGLQERQPVTLILLAAMI